MESPPSNSTWSEAFMLSDDSGLLLTNSSFSSGSMSGDSRSGRKHLHLDFPDSYSEEKSLSEDSLDGMSDIMYGENFNTLKKGPNWNEYKQSSPIEPPPEFQDKPNIVVDTFASSVSSHIISKAFIEVQESEQKKALKFCNHTHHTVHHSLGRHYWTPELIPFSPCHVNRPSSRSSLGSSRLSSSHNSLSVPTAHKVDDSTFITQAVSHDTLSSNQISDLYNVPFDSDVYAVPIDVIKPTLKPKRIQQHKKKRRNTSTGCKELELHQSRLSKKATLKFEHRCQSGMLERDTKRHSVAGTSTPLEGEPIHMTLQEVRQYLQTLYSSSSDSSDHKEKKKGLKNSVIMTNNNEYPSEANTLIVSKEVSECVKTKKNTFLINIKNKKVKDSCDSFGKHITVSPPEKQDKTRRTPAKLFSLKQTLCNMFRFKRFLTPERDKVIINKNLIKGRSISSRALPPLPAKTGDNTAQGEQTLDFATSIEKVKDYGWYWGPISSEAAEKILSNEPDGSFIVRDSSDHHYIFSLTFKLNNCVRHVRIEHDQGNFSFGSCTKFKSQTIVEFIENAVEHSRSGRYLFFLHRRPVIGPVRVQLLHPVSRFKQVQSLQHICRFAIHKVVRRDLIESLPLPRRMIDYLNTPHYYSEHLVDMDLPSSEPTPPSPSYDSDDQLDLQLLEVSHVPINNYIVINNTTVNTGQS